MTVRCVIVDDEAVARRLLRSFIDEVPWLACDGAAEDGPSAVEMIDARRPDLVFLDVRLPGLSGVEVLERITHQPAVAFTTAFDEYAIRALQLGAIEYLLKPFGRMRFLETTARIRERLQAVEERHESAMRAREMLRGDRPLRRLFVRQKEEIVPVELARVERIESADDYVVLHQNGARHLAHIALGELQEMLDPERFVRVHRSQIVNLDFVAAFREYDARRYLVVMRDGTRLIASRAGTSALRELVK